MEATLLFKPKPLLLSTRRRNISGNLCCIKSARFTVCSAFASIEVAKNSKNSTLTYSSKYASPLTGELFSSSSVGRYKSWFIPTSLSMERYGSLSNQQSYGVWEEDDANATEAIWSMPSHSKGRSSTESGISITKLQVGLYVHGCVQTDPKRNPNSPELFKENLKRISIELQKLLIHPPIMIGSIYWRGLQKRYLGIPCTGYPNIHRQGGCEKQLRICRRLKRDLMKTLVNLNGATKKNIATQQLDELGDKYFVVTILFAAKGEINLPIIKDNKDLKKALQMLQSIHTSKQIQGVNVLWTPQAENDIMSVSEFNQLYPQLRSLKRLFIDEDFQSNLSTLKTTVELLKQMF